MTPRNGDAAGLAWLFLLLLVGGVLSARAITQTARVDASSHASIASLFAGAHQSERPRLGYVRAAEAAPAPTAPAPAEAPTVASTAAPAPTPAPDRFRVAGTDGVGLAFYAAPRRDARLQRGLVEGAAVTVLERVGDAWARVRADDGQEGWVGATYLKPAE
jgi:hypothetical protein